MLMRAPSRLARLWAALRTWSGPFTLKESSWAALNAQFFSDGTPTYAGVRVTEETAFTFSAVYDAVNQISSDVAKLPLNLHKRLSNGGSEHYTTSKLYRLLKDRPNPDMGSMVFRRTIIAHALTLWGGFAEIVRDAVERPIELWPIHPSRVRLEEDRSGALIYIVTKVDGSQVTLPQRNVLHIHGLGPDGYSAYPVIEMARQAIGLGLAVERFGGAFFGHGATFGGLLEGAPTDPERRKELRRQINEQHGGPERAHKFLMISENMKYTKLGVDPQNAQAVELWEQVISSVAGFFNMPVYKLRVIKPGAVSYASVEQQALEYYKGPILNWVTLSEEEYNYKLIPSLERSQQFFKHNTNAFLRGDIKSRYDAYKVARDSGIINANEWRALEDMNPQDGEQGTLYLVQEQNIPLSSVQELVASKIKKNETPAPTPTAPAGGGGDRALADELTARAERAEALVAAARVELEAAQVTAAHLEGYGAAATEESGQARAAANALLARVATLEQIAADVTAERDRVIASVQTLEADRVAAHGARAEAEQRAAEAWQAKADAEQRLAAKEQDRLAAAALAEEMRAALETAESALRAESVDVPALEAERDRAKADADAAHALAVEAQTALTAERQRLAALTTRAEQAEADALSARQAAELATALAEDAERAKAEADLRRRLSEEAEHAAVAEAQARADERDQALASKAEADATRQAHADSEQALRATLAETEAAETRARLEAEAALALIRKTADAAEQEAQRLAGERQQVEAQLREQRESERQRRLAVVAAHRGLIVDALGRMTRRECQQARAKQATPQKLRAWLSGYADLQEAVCVEALLPAMRAHLAWQGSAEDPADVTARMVREHLAAFEGQIRAALEADAEDFHPRLDRVLTRWERDRAESVADALLTQEIRNV